MLSPLAISICFSVDASPFSDLYFPDLRLHGPRSSASSAAHAYTPSGSHALRLSGPALASRSSIITSNSLFLSLVLPVYASRLLVRSSPCLPHTLQPMPSLSLRIKIIVYVTLHDILYLIPMLVVRLVAITYQVHGYMFPKNI
nr:hypothetical protein Iba_chr03dCG4090 [Ipomoea batatas]